MERRDADDRSVIDYFLIGVVVGMWICIVVSITALTLNYESTVQYNQSMQEQYEQYRLELEGF
jgi:uncharacterized membrane-anchored protein YhcB (DUF1043 family)